MGGQLAPLFPGFGNHPLGKIAKLAQARPETACVPLIRDVEATDHKQNKDQKCDAAIQPAALHERCIRAARVIQADAPGKGLVGHARVPDTKTRAPE